MSPAKQPLRAAWAIYEKDLRAEFRTRYALSAIGLFALTTLTVVSFAVGPLFLEPDLLSALLWVILFFAAMAGLSRTFVHEEETRTAAALRLAAPPVAVYLGKGLFNLVLLLLLEVLIVPLFVVMMGLSVGNPWLFLLILFLGDVGLAGVTTVVGAMVAQASARGALFTVLSFPLLLPLLMQCIEGARIALAGGSLAAASSSVGVLLAYAVAMGTVSVMLFPAIWTEL
ncbi:MAG: heme exporter protein CcmB [Chloroflexia bacterium]